MIVLPDYLDSWVVICIECFVRYRVAKSYAMFSFFFCKIFVRFIFTWFYFSKFLFSQGFISVWFYIFIISIL